MVYFFLFFLCSDNPGKTPLYYACSKGLTQIVVELLNIEDIDLDLQMDDQAGGTALHGTLVFHFKILFLFNPFSLAVGLAF